MKNIWRYLVCLILVFGFVGASLAAQQNLVFSRAIHDFPLMRGALEIEEDGVSYDKPEGRILQMRAILESLTPKAVETYYSETLPQLGWQAISPRIYQRGAERLELDFEAADGQNFLNVTLSPQETGLR
jgi:hypothetical protein